MILLAPALSLALAAASNPVRIGYGEARPYCYTDRAGKPAGFLIDVFEEAAARERVALRWTGTGTSDENDGALAAGRLDLLPLAVASPQRRRSLHSTEPWWSEETLIVVRADAPPFDRAGPSPIALPEALLESAAKAYPEAERIAVVSAPQALDRVCNGTAAAALLGGTYIRDLVNGRPEACAQVRLRIYDSPARIDFSVVSGKHAAAIANRLHRRVLQMTADGTLAAIAARHPPISTPHANRMMNELRKSYEQDRMATAIFWLAAALAVGVFVLLWQLRAKRRLTLMVHKQKETERELLESQAALRERTAELIRSNEDLQAFAYSVSHDLQEPVRNQALYSELLHRRHHERLPDDARKHLDVIRTSALRAEAMIRSLLVYSKITQSGRAKDEVDCSLVVRGVLNELAAVIQGADASVHVGDLPTVWGWEDRLQQVFQNVIGNALKYRHASRPLTISIAAERDGEYWRFKVTDNGIGFKQEYAERIFGLFKRLHGHDRYQGSGIGLALCKRIIERHGGRIWVESREGQGSTFFFTVPQQP